MSAVGRVAAIYRYPVKSMAGESLDRADVTLGGLRGDRAYALIDDETGRVVSGKRPRYWADVMNCRAGFATPPGADSAVPDVLVTLQDGSEYDSSRRGDLDRAASEMFGRRVRLENVAPEGASFEYRWPDMEGLVYEGRTYRGDLTEHEMPEGTFFDSALVLVQSRAGMERMSELAPDSRFDVRRFRPNILIEDTSPGFAENDWVGRTLAIGDDVRFAITKPCLRCVMVTLPQPGLDRDPGVLRAAFDHNEGNLGVKAVPLSAGAVRAGDVVRIE